MRIGFIGAGKVGCSLGKYLVLHGVQVSGYYSRNALSAQDAAEFTETAYFDTLEGIAKESDALFITVSDSAIETVWEQLKAIQVRDKVICHCSGVLSSEIFSELSMYACRGYSVHPLLAISSRKHAYQELSHALFTIEGLGAEKQELAEMLRQCGNQVLFLKPEDKPRYHAAAVLASNLVLGLAETAAGELEQCGFSRQQALEALAPFMQANVSHLLTGSIEDALTGPMERGDSTTIQKHLRVLEGEDRELYRLLSKKAMGIAQRKHPKRSYTEIKNMIEKEIG